MVNVDDAHIYCPCRLSCTNYEINIHHDEVIFTTHIM